jgi:hypothetical protein
MSTNSTTLVLSAAKVRSIIASRSIVKTVQVGDTVRFHIQGNGVTIPVKTSAGAIVMANGTNIPLTKTIYGTKVNSQVAMMNERNRQLLKDAVAAEAAGADDFEVTKAFNTYLNKIQVSFSILHNPGRKIETFYNKQLVEAEVELITTDNGQLLTFTNVRPVKTEKLGSTPEFTLEDLMGLSADGPKAEDVFTPAEGVEADAEKA